MKFGLNLGRLNPALWTPAAVAADRSGFESVWMPEHLVLPVRMTGSPSGEHRPPPASTPVFDVFAYLAFLAGKTERIRLGTYVYNLALRHPFVSARAVQTLDVVSGGRAEVGVGAGWLPEEWDAAGLDFATRGRRLDEALGICRRLWTEDVVEHHGRFFGFGPVMFEPKPVQRPPRVLVGGESKAALRRAARLGDGWIGMVHTPESASARVDALRALTSKPLEVTVAGRPDDGDAFRDAGVDRLIVAPWARSAEALDGIRRFGGDAG